MNRDATIGWTILFAIVVLWAISHESSVEKERLKEEMEDLASQQQDLADEQDELEYQNAIKEDELERLKTQVKELEESADNAKRLR